MPIDDDALSQTAPFVFAWCPACKNPRHLTLITKFPATDPLGDACKRQMETVIGEYIREVQSMCARARRDLTVSSHWNGQPRPAGRLRDPRNSPEVMKWRRFNCWLADVKIIGRYHTVLVFAQGDGSAASLH